MRNDALVRVRRARATRLLVWLFVALSISSCSVVRIGYDLVPWYIARQLDKYWQLDATQSAFTRERIDELWRWHRRGELPEIVRWLRSVEARIEGSVDVDDVSGWRRMGVVYWQRAAAQLSPSLARLMATLRPEQIEAMMKRMTSENAEYRREFLPDDRTERQSRRIKRIEDKLDYFLGDLTRAQKDIVRRRAAAIPHNEEVWFAERIARQRDLLALLDNVRRLGSPLDDAQLEQARQRTVEFLLPFWEPRDPHRRQALEGVLRASDEITTEVLRIATPEQRARLSARLLGLANDLEALSRQGESAPDRR